MYTSPLPISTEARGLARDLLRRIKMENKAFGHFFHDTTAPLKVRLMKMPHRSPRPETLMTLATSWQTAGPQTFRISFEMNLRGSRGTVAECRLCAGSTQEPEWQNAEPGTAITRIRVRSDRHGVVVDQTPLVMISLHALARRFQRGRLRTDADVRDDLAILAAAIPPEDAEEGEKLSISMPHGGVWLGYAGPDRTASPSKSLRVWVRTYME